MIKTGRINPAFSRFHPLLEREGLSPSFFVIFCSQFHPTDIFNFDQTTFFICFEHNFLKFSGFFQSSPNLQINLIHLPFWGWWLPNSPNSHLQVLIVEGIYNILSRQIAAGKPHWIKPYSHSIAPFTVIPQRPNSFNPFDAV